MSQNLTGIISIGNLLLGSIAISQGHFGWATLTLAISLYGFLTICVDKIKE